MRGDDQQQSGMFSCISAEQRVPESHPLRPLRKMVGCSVGGDVAAIHAAVREARPAVDRAGEASARVIAASVLHDPQ